MYSEIKKTTKHYPRKVSEKLTKKKDLECPEIKECTETSQDVLDQYGNN